MHGFYHTGTTKYADDLPLGPFNRIIFAAAIHKELNIPTGTVGLIIQPLQAEHILAIGQADVVILARKMLRNPYWVLHSDVPWPNQYLRAKPR